MTEYRLNVPDETWDAWKQTVPRGQRLSTRIERLIEADLANDASILKETPAPQSNGGDSGDAL